MPKGRMLNRSISRSRKVARLSMESNLLFSWSIPHLDRKGKIWADSATLKGIVVPYLDYMTLEVIEKCKTELHDSGLAMIYGDGLYMFFLGFDHNQKIEHNEKASEIPDPAPEDVEKYKQEHCPDKVGALPGHLPDKVPPKRERELKRELKEKQPSAALQAALTKVLEDGFNIYALIIKTKGQLKQPKDFEFPEEVLLKVCEAYWREKTTIRQPWPWFVKVLADEQVRWNVNQQITQGEAYKKEGMASSIAEILRGMVK
jgi:hypothetical protein